MKLKHIDKVTSEEEAREIAINFQLGIGNKSISYGELFRYNEYFEELGNKFGIREEFEENGII